MDKNAKIKELQIQRRVLLMRAGRLAKNAKSHYCHQDAKDCRHRAAEIKKEIEKLKNS